MEMLTSLYVRARNLMTSEEGATATEYALLVALIAIIIVAGVRAFGGALDGFFDEITARVNAW